MAAAIQTMLPPLERAAIQSARGVICVKPEDSNRAESSAVSTRCTTLDIINWLAPTTPPTTPAAPISQRRAVQPASSRRSTRSANCAASGSSLASPKRRSRRRSKSTSAIAAPPFQSDAVGRRQSRSELIQTTFDMRFDRSKWQVQGIRRFLVRQPRAKAHGDADTFRGAQDLERLVEIDPAVGIAPAAASLDVNLFGGKRANS